MKKIEVAFDQAQLTLDKGEQAVKDAVTAIRNALRAGTASTKSKGEVAGSNKKLWKQKGTGNARAGFRQSPVWRGGGVAHGPHPRSYEQKINKKVMKLAFARAFSDKLVAGDVIVVDHMTINLATYQVSVYDKPIDFTYLEYALLSFLVRHPGRTFSRDALLQHVWGFDYYGGSRTVDVHVRRIRAKLGPELAQRLETVRGVGYLWSS